MSVDVDAVNERLNGLVTLLQAVGIDSLDVAGLGKSLGGAANGSNNKGGEPARQLNDEQIEAIIRKLQQAQAEAPQIIAALEAHAEARSLGGTQRQQQEQPPQQQEDEDSTEEDDDEANYPMVGHGISDDISVVSDLTTPTVLTGVPVPEEEHYRDTLPPMHVGGGPGGPPMLLNPSKRKNLVNATRPNSSMQAAAARRNVPASPAAPAQTAKAQGVAAKRRTTHTQTMAKLGPETRGKVGAGSPPQRQLPSSSGAPPSRNQDPASVGSNNPNRVVRKKVIKKKPPATGNPAPATRKVVTPAAVDVFGSEPQNGGWNAFESSPVQKSTAAPTVIDNDGFLVGDVGFDPFQTAPIRKNNAISSPAGDLAFDMPPRRPKQSSSSATGPSKPRPTSNSDHKSSSNILIPPPPQAEMQQTFSQLRTRPANAPSAGRRKVRRASLAS